MNRRVVQQQRESADHINLEIVEAMIRGNRIKKVLDSQNLTQEEAARRAGISYRHFNRLVLGRSEPSLLIGLKLQKVLGQNVEKLFEIAISTRRARVVRDDDASNTL